MKSAATGLGWDDTVKVSSPSEVRLDSALGGQIVATSAADSRRRPGLPYHPAGVVGAFARTSEDRKPRPEMAKAAAAALNLDLTSSWVVGDRPEDLGLAEAIGTSAIFVGPGSCRRQGVWSFPNLAAAAPFILERIVV